MESTTKNTSRGSTSGRCYYIMLPSMKIKRRRPRIGAVLPIPNLRFSFLGPTTTTRDNKDNDHTTAMTDAILDDVLATLGTTTTTTNKMNITDMSQERLQIIHKRVSFCTKKDEVHHILSRHEISSKEYKTAWYSRVELESISESCFKQIHAITSNNNNYYYYYYGSCSGGDTDVEDEEESCTIRGLESFTPVAAMAKKLNRSTSVQTVLLKQKRHKEQQRNCPEEVVLRHHDDKGGDHAEAIRVIYHSISSSSQLWAHAVALKDRRDVEDMMMDDDECWRDRFSMAGQEKLESPHLKDGGSRSRRVVYRSHSSPSTKCSTRETRSTRSKDLPRNNGPAAATTTATCTLEGTTMALLDPAEAAHQRVMALAA